AETHLLRAVAAHPGFMVGYWNLGTVRQRRQDWQGAAAALEQAVRLQPQHFEVRRLLARAYLMDKRYSEAERELRGLLETHPEDINGEFYLAWALAKQGRDLEADVVFRRGLEKAPDWPTAMAQGAWLLATHPDDVRRNGSLARFQAEMALRALKAIEKQPDENLLEAAAAASAECGDFDAALAYQTAALRLPNLPTERKAEMEKRLRLYQQKQPYRLVASDRRSEPP
ncbi:MAG: tetratricopeptide repeat protein, partial [Gemmatales bacterium]|nr:tetratricopeptide repeat protein [Gemmatales bacterium]MDW8388072.1 tetratricopeptide repeat protein [Gemmatales bacterium]